MQRCQKRGFFNSHWIILMSRTTRLGQWFDESFHVKKASFKVSVSCFQRYYANEVYYQEGAPIFIYVGGDYEIGTYWIEHGHMHDIAFGLNGYLLGIEMRYFGQNRPTSDVSTANLQFLSTEQVLADIALLIEHIKQEDSRLANAKVILTGTMFGGNLATWFRVKYPHLADGVWSSSSYVEARMNFAEYFEVIGEDMKTFGSNECYRRTWRAFRTMQNLIDGGRSEVIDEMFHLCHPLDVADDFEVQRFFEAITESIVVGILNGGYSHVHDMCVAITNNNFTNDLIAFNDWFVTEHHSTGCFEMTLQEVIDFLIEPEWDSFGVITGRRQFQYLTCTEYGWFTTTDSDNQPFGNRLKVNYSVELCRRVFGDWITEETIRESTEAFNLNFGGSRPEITNALFTNGGLDPHRAVNVQDDIGETVEARTLPRKAKFHL